MQRLGMALFVLAIVNFAAFVIIALSIGGDAINGQVQNDHYYLSHKGKLTEVSPNVWRYSWMHATSVWITHPLGMLGAWLAGRGQQKSRRRG